ncbi:MAG: class I tRNA ligase family protein, partial [Nitratireductor sp.]|nr:class I tRNA ligase family protein [Nitratireductor sp.]
SKGNVIDPLELIDDYGADALRFTLAIMAAQGRDVKLDPDRIAGYRNFGTKLWNATRFAEMNGAIHGSSFDTGAVKLTVNRWILAELSKAVSDVTGNIEKYRFNDAANAAYKFVWNTLCDWYVELLKPVFAGDDEAAKSEAQACLGHVLDETFKLLNPFMPFMTEELWSETAKRNSLLCHAEWPEPGNIDEKAADEVNWLVSLISEIRSVRAEMGIKPGAYLPLVIVDADASTREHAARHEPALHRLARVEPVEFASAAPKGSAQIVLSGALYCLPLAGVVDLSAESERLEKEVTKLDGEIRRLEGKLGNEKFVANAPEAVVAEERDKLSAYHEQREKTVAALERIRQAG